MPDDIDMYLYNPVLNGFWKQHELWDGTYTILDLFEMNEAMRVKNVNEEKIMNHLREKQQRESELRQFRGRS